MTVYLGILGDRKAEVFARMKGVEHVETFIEEVNVDFGAAGVIDICPLLTPIEKQRIAADFEEQNMLWHLEALWTASLENPWN